MNALQGVWEKAREEFREYKQNGEWSKEPEHVFCMAYLFGTAYGLALSTVRSDLVQKFEAQFRKRGWLQEHEGYKPNTKNKPEAT